jgi:hypothetical protein
MFSVKLCLILLPLLLNDNIICTLFFYFIYSILTCRAIYICLCVCNSAISINGRFYVAALTCPYLMHKYEYVDLFNIPFLKN